MEQGLGDEDSGSGGKQGAELLEDELLDEEEDELLDEEDELLEEEEEEEELLLEEDELLDDANIIMPKLGHHGVSSLGLDIFLISVMATSNLLFLVGIEFLFKAKVKYLF